jgi:hypothetical protein
MKVNDLLLWLSAKGAGGWSSYRTKIDEMLTAEDGDIDESTEEDNDMDERGELPIYHRIRLNLESLGHVEFFRGGFPEDWRVVPPTLACHILRDSVVGILCGARSDRLFDRIRKAVSDLDINVTAQDNCPDRIQLTAENQRRLQLLGEQLGLRVQSDSARTLLAAIPPVDDWQLRSPAELPFGNDWDVGRFSASSLEWKAATAVEAREAPFGLFRFKLGYRPQYFAKLQGNGYKVPVQVGKYLFLRKARRHVVSYDSEQQQLSFPISCRPPILIDRALTLCVGLIPQINGGRLTYPNVGRMAAEAATTLLRQ